MEEKQPDASSSLKHADVSVLTSDYTIDMDCIYTKQLNQKMRKHIYGHVCLSKTKICAV